MTGEERFTCRRLLYSHPRYSRIGAGRRRRSVNTTQVVANWLIGREIVDEEQRGRKRAEYGKALLKGLSAYLHAEFGRGYPVNNLEWFRMFYVRYPSLLEIEKFDAPRRITSYTGPCNDFRRTASEIRQADAYSRRSE